MFQNLHEYYDYIETQKELQKNHNISIWLTQLRDKIEDASTKKLCSYELFIEDFHISKNTLKPRTSFQNNDGVMQEYPNLELFEDNLEYLKLRSENVLNPKLKAKYNHILWLSKIKHKGFAIIAIDNYFDFLKSSVFDPADVLTAKAFAGVFENLFALAQQVSHKKEEILDYLISIIGTNKINGYQEYSVMGFITDEGKKINERLRFFSNYCNGVIDENTFPDFKKEYLKLQLILTQKLGEPLAPFHNKLAEVYLEESKIHEGSFVVQNFYSKALQQYQKAGNREKMEEVSVLMEKAKNNLNLKTQKFEFSDPLFEEYFKVAESTIDKLIENFEPKDLYEYLIASTEIFPKGDLLLNDINTTMMQLVSVTAFDINKNISGKSGSGFNMYDIYVKSLSLPHLAMFFQKGFKSGKLSFQSLNEYLLNNTWYGYDAELIRSDGSALPYRWMNLITPSLQSFFDQSEIDYKLNRFNMQAYMLCIDSLTLKFEGLLREFSRKIGAQTIEIKDNSTEERISFEKLLENQKFIDTVSPDNIALFKYLFTNQGINLRNNIAHCFYLPMNYSVQWMWLLIVAILKLGNYEFKLVPQDVN